MFHVAVTFPSKEASESSYQALQEALRKSNSGNVSVFRLTAGDAWYIVVLGTSTDSAMQRAIDRYLPVSRRITLPDETVQALAERREQRIPDAKSTGKPGMLFTETHKPTRIDATGNVLPLQPEQSRPGKPFTATITQAPSDSPLQPGKVKMRVIPFVVGYQQLHMVDITSTTQGDVARSVASLINQVNQAALKSAEKYIFTDSALRLHTSVYRAGTHEWMLPGMHTWIELQTSINTPYGDRVKALYWYRVYSQAEIDRVMPASRDKYLHDLLTLAISPHAHHWSLELITERCETFIDFTYDDRSHALVWTSDHICPHKQCAYPKLPDPATLNLGVCDPCAYCKQAALYWFGWLHFAHKMVQGDYAITPDQPHFSVDRQEYQQSELVTVGHGKNQRRVRQEVTRHINYKVIAYDVSIKRPSPVSEVEPHEKRANWLVMHGSEDIIWERRSIPNHTMRYPTRKNGTRLEGLVSVHYDQPKWVPMLQPAKRKATIKKVTAKQFESEE